MGNRFDMDEEVYISKRELMTRLKYLEETDGNSYAMDVMRDVNDIHPAAVVDVHSLGMELRDKKTADRFKRHCSMKQSEFCSDDDCQECMAEWIADSIETGNRHDSKLEALELSVKPYKILRMAKVETVEQLRILVDYNLLHLVRNLSKKNIEEIKKRMSEHYAGS